ncbi:M48 family metallopeptidase [Chitinophaga sp. YIM B06452]|uniref:M48 family metallopeptidase n=1 Tax=Chitinophaga sp. YIM B06452 TaxID=3082158 RepID=UPI0031FF1308
MFKGNYYNHQVAKATPVNIHLFTESLQLDVITPGAPPRKLHWLFTEIATHVSPGFIRITRTGEEAGTLEVTDPVFVKEFLARYKHTRSAGLHQLVLRGGLKASLIILLVIAGVLLAGHFYFLPWCVSRVVDQLPSSFDKELGGLARNSLHETPDKEGSQLLTQFAAQIKWDTQEKLDFTVVDSDVENAYSLPGGYVVVYTGLLKKLETPEQLAALLGHEVAHITHRHGVRRLCQEMGTGMLVSIALGNSGGVNLLYAKAATLHNLTYSRGYEREADISGMETLRRNRINQLGMLQLLQELQKLDGKVAIPEFIRSHPLTENRVNYVRRDAEEHPASFARNERMEALFKQLQARYH